MMSFILNSFTWVLGLASLGSVYLYYILGQRSRHKNLPPFPVTPLPFVGNLLSIEKNPRKQILRWREQFGDIFSLDMAGKVVVFVNGYKSIKEIYVKNGHRCSHRPVLFHDSATDTVNLGIGTSSGPQWKEERATAYTILRSFGMGNNKRAKNIEEEIYYFVEELEHLNGDPTDIHYIVMIAVCNTVISLLFGKRFDYEDQNLKKIVETIVDIMKTSSGTQILQFYPKLVNLPGDLFQGKKLKKKILESFNWVNDMFVKNKDKPTSDDENVSTLDDEGVQDNDYIVAYFKEMMRKQKNGATTYMSTKTVLKSISDLITAGTESTTTNIMWFVLFCIHYPEVQEKAFKEIEKHVGTERLPNMDDKKDLNYVNAAIQESQRLASITPFPIMHVCSNDVNIDSYTLPKGTNVSINLDSVFYDKTIWGEDVYNFRPERFLDKNGEVFTPEEFIPYSTGRRQCLAEAYAKTQLFMFFASLFQRFKFMPENPSQLPPMKDVFGLASPPVPYKVRILDRRKM